MKRGTPDHPKIHRLCLILKIPIYSAVGLLEMLWHFTAKYALQGDIGRFSDREIAKSVGWDKSPTKLISALTECRWLDLSPEHRLLVHDWEEHADQTVRRVLVNRGLKMLASSQHHPSTVIAGSQHHPSQPVPVPLPVPFPIPQPIPPPRENGVCAQKDQIAEVRSMLVRLGALYHRPEGQAPTNFEEATAAELIRQNPKISEELEFILAYRASIKPGDVRYFPSSLSRLLGAWQETLDRARVNGKVKDPAEARRRHREELDKIVNYKGGD